MDNTPIVGPAFCCTSFARFGACDPHYSCKRLHGLQFVVEGCPECADEVCEIEAHRAENLTTYCNACPTVADHFRADDNGNVHAACAGHQRYLWGWVQDTNHEMHCDSIASRRFEEAAYGRD